MVSAEIVAAVQQVLGARGQRERKRQRARRLDRSVHPFDREREIIDRMTGVAGEILDRATDHAGVGCARNRLCRGVRIVRAAILQVRIDRPVGRPGNSPAILDDGIEADGGAAESVGEPEARGRERLESHRGEQFGGAAVPGIGDDEGAGADMQRAKRFGFFHLAAHQ